MPLFKSILARHVFTKYIICLRVHLYRLLFCILLQIQIFCSRIEFTNLNKLKLWNLLIKNTVSLLDCQPFYFPKFSAFSIQAPTHMHTTYKYYSTVSNFYQHLIVTWRWNNDVEVMTFGVDIQHEWAFTNSWEYSGHTRRVMLYFYISLSLYSRHLGHRTTLTTNRRGQPTVDRLSEFVGEYVDRWTLLRYSVQVLFCIFHSRPHKYCNDKVKLCLCLTNQWAHGIFLQTKGKHE